MEETDSVHGALQSFAASAELRAVIDSVNDYAIFLLDPEGIVATWNRGAQRLKGYQPADIIGQSFMRFYTQPDLDTNLPKRLLAAAARDGRVESEGWRVRKDGTRFWADVVISALRDETGGLRGFVKVTRDLTDRRAAEEALRQSEERMRLMIDGVRDYAIFMLDPSGIVTTWNRGAERLKGYLDKEIIGRHFSAFYPAAEVAAGKPQQELEIAARTGRFEEEGIRVRKDGSEFWANVVLTAIRTGEGQLVGYAKVTRDITDRKRAEEENQRRARQQEAVALLGIHALQSSQLDQVMERALQRTREVLGRPLARFVASASQIAADESSVPIHGADGPHGFLCVPGPLGGIDASFVQSVANVVSTALGRMRMEEQLREVERRAVEERSRAAQAQEALRERDEFISIAAHELRTPLTALQLKLQGLERTLRNAVPREYVRIGTAVRQTERMASLVDRLLDVSRISQGRMELVREEVDLAALLRQVSEDFRDPAAAARSSIELDVPESAPGRWDRLRIEQVLVNVLSNAVKYGAGKPIFVKLTAGPAAVRLEVTDHGIGIASEDQGRIFGRFERAVPARNYGGMGLGLYVTRHIVEAHGGAVSVQSTLGEGSTFVIELPRAPGAAQVRA